MSGIFSSTIGRKIAMALSAFFLMIFLIIHLSVNITSIFSANLFNNMSHFMGTNMLVQTLMQPVLMVGVIFHFVMGFYLEMKNRNARTVKYAQYSGNANASWASRNMIYSGLAILLFLGLHLYDFWLPEMTTKYVEGDMTGMINGEFRYHEELVHKFQPVWRVILYCLAFVFLALHLRHGFSSAFQSMGMSAGREKILKTLGNIYAIVIPLGFIIVALYHFAIH